MRKELTWKQAINRVLDSSPTPLHYKEITEQIISEGLRTTVGATPAATVNAQITGSIKSHGEKSPYIRVAAGTFTLRNRFSSESSDTTHMASEITQSEEEQYEIITSFGMFWKRDRVDWPIWFGSNTRLLTESGFIV
ncbi:MAG: winged helix-turn-helix domain-containing protein [Acidobacteriota bacterium]